MDKSFNRMIRSRIVNQWGRRIGVTVACLAAWCLFEARPARAEIVRSVEIKNPLAMDWPGELVYVDMPTAEASSIRSVRMGDRSGRVQIEPIDAKTSRVWFIASIRGDHRDAKNNKVSGETKVEVHFETDELPDASSSASIGIQKQADALTIENGLHAIRVPSPKVSGSSTLSSLPGPIGPFKVGAGAWFGTSRWEGDARVRSVDVDVKQGGPIFADVVVRYVFDESSSQMDSDNKLPWADVEVADESWAKFPEEHFYEMHLRVTAGVPWVDVQERYRMPAGELRHWIEVREDFGADTVMWIPWFGFEKFGGNVELRFHPMRPQNQQRGPFVMMRPVWNQQPGGGQDFFITRTGETPYIDRNTKEQKGSTTYDASAPAFGVAAVRASRWLNPYAQTIAAFAENDNAARIRFNTGVGARAWGLAMGPRSLFDSTSKMNGLVRRSADFTLADVMHRYRLDYQGKPNGPRILMTRADRDRIRDDLEANRDTPETRAVKKFDKEYASRPRNEQQILDHLLGRTIKNVQSPTPQIMLERRFQDDFLNPTQRFNRDMDDRLALVDLVSDKPWAGPVQAAIGYVFTNPDRWPGYLNGFAPGNPNFHTDMYTVAAYAAAAMPDHPDADDWMAFAKKNWLDDVGRVLLPPDGVGYECPGYAGYSLVHQLELARVFLNSGAGNLVADNPLFRATGNWHRHLLTPSHPRLGHRHTAPIGDTHKWTSGLNDGFGLLAKFYKTADPKFASDMMAVWLMLREQYLKTGLLDELIGVDWSIKPSKIESMDWGSHAFEGFGTIMRSRFGSPRETFVSFKAGSAQGHYHNDDLSYHFYGDGTPLSLDYNCSYTPRGDHAALHNSMTFGISRPFRHTGEDRDVHAMEQLTGPARVLAFKSTPAADVVVAERRGDSLRLSPVNPLDAKFQYPYPSRTTSIPITHRRYLMLVKHDEKSKLADYLVVRDETRSADRQHLHIHLLARDVKEQSHASGRLFHAPGQWETDAVVYLSHNKVNDVVVDAWWYADEWMNGPGLYKVRQNAESEAANKVWLDKVRDSKGEALIPPVGWNKTWTVGEYQKWIRVETAPNTPMTWILYPQKPGTPMPTFETLDDGSIRVTLEGESETVYLGTTSTDAGQAWIEQRGQRATLLESATIKPMP